MPKYEGYIKQFLTHFPNYQSLEEEIFALAQHATNPVNLALRLNCYSILHIQYEVKHHAKPSR